MRRPGLSRRISIFLTVLQWLAGVFSSVIAACLKADPTWWQSISPAIGILIRRLQQSAPIVVPLLILLLPLLGYVKRIVGDSWAWQVIKSQIDALREHAFRDRGGSDPQHQHRATLFKHVGVRWRWCKWPWSGWLVPVERSGYLTRKPTPAFLAPDDGESAEGVAGRTWSMNSILPVHGLPEVTLGSDQATLEEYARKTFVTTDWLKDWPKREKRAARSFYGIPVEARGTIWGVVVLDSSDEHAIGPKDKEVFKLIVKNLGKLLEKA